MAEKGGGDDEEVLTLPPPTAVLVTFPEEAPVRANDDFSPAAAAGLAVFFLPRTPAGAVAVAVAVAEAAASVPAATTSATTVTAGLTSPLFNGPVASNLPVFSTAFRREFDCS